MFGKQNIVSVDIPSTEGENNIKCLKRGAPYLTKDSDGSSAERNVNRKPLSLGEIRKLLNLIPLLNNLQKHIKILSLDKSID